MRPLAAVTAAALAVTLLASCSADASTGAATAATTDPATDAPRATTAGPTTSAPAGTPAQPAPTITTVPATTAGTARPEPSDPGTLTMAFAGDVHFEDYLAPLAARADGLAELRSSLGAADLAVVNLETAITNRGTKIGKEFHFRAPASALRTVQGAGVDAVSVANNPGVAYGPGGLEDTLAAKKASPIPIVGIGADEDEAYAPAVLRSKGLEVALFGASEVFEMTLSRYSAGPDTGGIASAAPVTRLRRAVSAASRRYDVVVVFLHWGLDYQKCPDPLSAETAQALEEAGADIIVGGHSHRVNGAGWLGRSYVAYGLGNFVWWRGREPDSRSGVLTLSLDVKAAKGTGSDGHSVVRSATWTPMLIGTDGIPRRVGAADTKRLHGLWEQANACTGLEAKPA